MRNAIYLLAALILCIHSACTEKASAPPTAANSIRDEYAAVKQQFKKAYGEDAVPEDISFIQAMLFFRIRPWLKDRKNPQLETFTYNPGAATQLKGLKRNKSRCRFRGADGQYVTLWETVTRSNAYLDRLVEASKSQGVFPWSNSYLLQPHVQNRSRDLRTENPPSSKEFDQNVLFSLHSSFMDGSELSLGSQCGKIAEFKRCERDGKPSRDFQNAREVEEIYKHLTDYFAALRSKGAPIQDPIRLATEVQRNLNLLHPFWDGNGRTSFGLMQLVLKSLDLPIPSVEHGYLDTNLDFESHVKVIDESLRRTNFIVRQCAAYVECVKKDSGKPVDWDSACSKKGENDACAWALPTITFNQQPPIKLDACDCSTRWKEQTGLISRCVID